LSSEYILSIFHRTIKQQSTNNFEEFQQTQKIRIKKKQLQQHPIWNSSYGKKYKWCN